MAVQTKKTGTKQATQTHLPFSEIRNNCVVLKDGGLRAIIKTSAVNFNLKSEDEQNATISAYQGFLNSLEFPVQITIRSKKLDLDTYFQMLEEQHRKQFNPVLQSQTREYIDYLKKLVEYADIMEKNFFVTIPVDPKRKEVKNFFMQFLDDMKPEDSLEKVRNRYEEFKGLFEILEKRVELVSGGLERCGLQTKRLQNEELVRLYYEIYNPLLARSQKIS